MAALWIAFITGLTTGGLSCMAVQGGLLASSLANQIEQDLSIPRGKKKAQKPVSPRIALPILLFLLAKLTAYTPLGLLLGSIGSVLQLTPTMQAILQFAIAIFMIGNALRMLNVHPIFRFFSFEPPASITRFIRKKAKNSTSLVTPLFLGFLTVLIPCGVTQTMMAAAIATGSPLLGAALMFAFTLGTSPVFFILSYFATRLGTLLEKKLVRVVAIVLIVLGILAVDTGLNLLGSRVSLTRAAQAILNQEQAGETTQTPIASNAASPDTIILKAVNDGYEPRTLHAPANKVLTLEIVTDNTRSCSRAFLIPELNFQVLLDATGVKTVQIPAQEAGKVISFTCSMGMYTGEIVFDI
jgi:sulfite exporter TauE/SafE